MSYTSMQHGFSAGEMSPRLFGRNDLAKYALGCSTMRNFYVDYRGGASSRAGFAYVGMCKQDAPNSGGTATAYPPRDIPFQFSIDQGYALEFGDDYMRIKSDGAYVVEDVVSVTDATNADPAVFTAASHGFSNGDWLYITGSPGMLNNIVFVAGQSSNSLLIIENGTVEAVTVGTNPMAVALTSDGARAYVVNSGSNNVSVVDVASRTVIATVAVGTQGGVGGIAITPNDAEAYVSNPGSDNVSVISTVSNTVTHTITVGDTPQGVTVLPSGTKVYVANPNSDTVTPITVSTHTAGSAIAVGNTPAGVSATPNSSFVYVTNADDGTVKVIETTGDTVTATITVGTYPIGLAVTPDGGSVYVANYQSDNISVIETTGNTVTDTISVSAKPYAVAVSSDGENVYTESTSNLVSTIETAGNTVTGTIAVSGGAAANQSVAIFSTFSNVITTGFAQLNGLTWVVTNVTTDTFRLTDLFGHVVDSTDWGTFDGPASAARIYTVAAPYDAIDLPFLKYTQSADTMTLTCVNQQTQTEYPSYSLVRNGATNWVFTEEEFAASIDPPANVSAVANPSGALTTYYAYVVTAVDAATGEESIASEVANVQNNDISIAAGSNTITWDAVAGAGSYNIYGATPSYGPPVPVGSSFGYMGTAFGTQFTDTNIVADFTAVPPLHNNPFARGTISGVAATGGGTSYTQDNVTYNITTSAGTGAVIVPVVINGAVVAYIVQSGGENYAEGDTITITSSGAGAGATATLTVGPESGTYPGVCAYFQQRRGYANTLNQPDTYFFSQPGAFTNMDAAIPATDSSAITGAPWAQQINGIQFMIPMNPGLIILTGMGAWLLNGGDVSAFTPASQTAEAQSYNGCHFHIPPLIINLDMLYVQAKGSIVRNLSFNFFQNIFTGADMTVLSEHLFNFHQIEQWAYAEEPYKIVWAVRDDGILLSFTYLKEQDVYGWARHDSNGLFVGICSIIEPPVDAVYAIVKRYIAGEGEWVYYAERMDNRNWLTVEDAFCVDAGLSLAQSFPDAILTPDAADGTDNISAINIIDGGSDYTSPLVSAVDPTGTGSGFSATLSVSGGVITGYTIVTQGQNYQPGTVLNVTDDDGSGAVLAPMITNIVNFSVSDGVFESTNVGDVIRIGNNNATPASGFSLAPIGGGKAVITTFFSPSNVAADIIEPITNVVPNDPNDTPIPVNPNYWSISTPVDTVSGLNHLEGMEVAILADGNVVTTRTVEDGEISLPRAYSAVTVGLPFLPQLQTLYLNPQVPGTVQGKRKNIQAVTVRVENTRGLSIGSNQVDASTQPNGVAPDWVKLYELKQRNVNQPPGTAIPLFTGDMREQIGGDWQKPGQVAFQQNYPLPANILAVIPEFQIGDSPG